MSIAALIRSMAEAGASPEAIALAVEAVEAAEAKVTARKAQEAQRTRRYRERGGGNIPDEMRLEVMERDAYTCQDCGSGEHLQCDHVHPVSKGGETTVENLQVLCRVCNARKKDRVRKSRGNSAELHGNPAASEADPFPSSLPPTPPNLTTHTRSDITTRVREDLDFVLFWEAYPRKVGKGEARKKYGQAARKIGDGYAAILSGALERAQAAWVDPQFIPHAATWLHQERWEDEPTVIQLNPRKANGHHSNRDQSDRDQRIGNMLEGAMAAVNERRR